MIQVSDLLHVKNWFESYVKEFCSGYEKNDAAICLKVLHTRRVALEILSISNSLDLNEKDCYLAEIAAYLHDIGRFEQYARYQTYSDLKSVDHAALGVEVINRTGVLGQFSESDRTLLLNVIAHHNRATVPDDGDERFLLFLKLLRDADKIDIYHVVNQHYSGHEKSEQVKIGLPDTNEVSDAIIQSLMEKKIAKTSDVKSLNDFKLLQIGWVFDFNFQWTFDIVKKRNYINKIASVLPETDNIKEAVSIAIRYLESKCTDASR